MAAQKFTKKDLKQDSFVESTEKVLEFLQRNATVVGVALLVVVVLLVGGTYVSKGRAAARVEASYMLYEGQNMLGVGDYEMAIAPLSDCIEQHGGTEFGKVARLYMVQALLGLGQIDEALVRTDEYLADFSTNDPHHGELLLIKANALADAGRYAEAADLLAEQTTDDLDDTVFYSRSVRRAEWLREAGQHTAALSLLEDLDSAAAAGELQVYQQDLDRRIAVTRALAN